MSSSSSDGLAAGRPRPRAYRRPMGRWWWRDAFYGAYMLRELTALAVMVYAIVLTVGAVRLSQGEAAWNGWLTALRSPLSIGLHVVLLIAMLLHAKSWFEIMPKTMAPIHVGGRRLAASTITRTGWLAVIVASLIVFALAAWGGGA